MGTLKGGYIIPADPLPEDDYCLQVYIPANTDYLIQFFTALAHFGKWNSWKRLHDGSNLEKQVADRWKVSIEKTHDRWAIGGCEMYQLRQSSSNPCLLEQSTDGGATWSTAFDYSLCLDNITVLPPYPGSETGASDAAAAAVRNIFEKLVQLVDCGAGRDAYIVAATAYMRTFDASYANPAALGAIFDAYCADPDAGDPYKTDCQYADHKDDIEACTNSDGLMDWLNCLNDTVIDWLNTSSDALMDALNAAAAALSGNGWQNAGAGGAGGGAGFGADCIWSHTWNAANGWTGWGTEAGNPDYGLLSGGIWNSVDAGGYTVLLINSPVLGTDASVTEVNLKYTVTGATPPGGQHRWFRTDSGGDHLVEALDWTPATYDYVYSTPINERKIQLDFEAAAGYITVALTEVKITGTGLADPYA